MSPRHAVGLASLLTVLALSGPVQAQSGFGQAPGERSAQLRLPKSAAPLWTTLRKTRIGEDARRGIYTASFPPEVKALDGTQVTLSGFMLPMDTAQRSKHFLFARYTPVCFFCPPGEPNEVVEVISGPGVKLTGGMITLSGRMTLTNNGEKGLFFRLDQGG
jgi:hypothetical protein